MTTLKKKYKERGECEHIVSYRGRKIDSNIQKAWDKAKSDAKITRRIRLYDIRHFYITYAMAMGADIAELSERTGNTPETITRYYLHLAKDLQKKEAFKIPSLSQTVEKTVDGKEKARRKRAVSY